MSTSTTPDDVTRVADFDLSPPVGLGLGHCKPAVNPHEGGVGGVGGVGGGVGLGEGGALSLPVGRALSALSAHGRGRTPSTEVSSRPRPMPPTSQCAVCSIPNNLNIYIYLLHVHISLAPTRA
jgi:hypothetical protein